MCIDVSSMASTLLPAISARSLPRRISYSESENGSGAFSINDQGQIVVADIMAVSGNSATLTVRVTDEGGLSDTATVTVLLVGESIFDNGFEI